MPSKKPPLSIYRLKITLVGIEPPIWRVIQAPSTILLCCLHDALQAVLGWTDSHLHQLEKYGKCWGVPEYDDFDECTEDEQGQEAKIAKGLAKPTRDELERHMTTHMPFDPYLNEEAVAEVREHWKGPYHFGAPDGIVVNVTKDSIWVREGILPDYPNSRAPQFDLSGVRRRSRETTRQSREDGGPSQAVRRQYLSLHE